MWLPKIPRVRAGDPITEGLLNSIAERFEKFANLRSDSPYIRILDSPYGKSIALARPERTFARLSGSTSPYDWTEVREGPGDTWVDMPNGDSGIAYEYNGLGGLDGKCVPVTWTSAGDWRFQFVGYGPPPNPCVGKGNKITFTLTGCNGRRVPGATVDFVLSGTTVYSGTTDAAGQVIYSEPAPGTYTTPWSIKTIGGTSSPVISGACGSAFAGGDLLTAVGTTNYACCPPLTSTCVYPKPRRLFITDINGTQTFNYDPTFGYWSSSGFTYTDSFGVDRSVGYRLDCNGTLNMLCGPVASTIPCASGPPGDPAFEVPFPYSAGLVMGVFDLCDFPFPTLTGTMGATTACNWLNPVAGPWTLSL